RRAPGKAGATTPRLARTRRPTGREQRRRLARHPRLFAPTGELKAGAGGRKRLKKLMPRFRSAAQPADFGSFPLGIGATIGNKE
ncbi:MAG TPA: hypothetical protein VFQ82_05280, partial [Stellaceae bacterium]|nr:hypothetical protein [Stellaceae bacterium]